MAQTINATTVDRQFNSDVNAKFEVLSSNPDVSLRPQGAHWFNSTLQRLIVQSVGSTTQKNVAYTDDVMTPAAHYHNLLTVTSDGTAGGTTLQALLNTKQNTITGAATTIVSSNLTVNRALISDASGKVAVSNITNTELSYLSGATSSIQTQLNGMIPLTQKGAASGVCPLGSDTKIPTQYLPGYVDDIQEFMYMQSTTPAVATSGKRWYDTTNKLIHTSNGSSWGTGVTPLSDALYVFVDTNAVYRWTGSDLAQLPTSVAISTSNPANIGTTASPGVSGTVSASDHVHILDNNVVTNAKLADMPTLTVKGNITEWSADPADIPMSTLGTTLITNTPAMGNTEIFTNSAITPSSLEATWVLTTIPVAKKRNGYYAASVAAYRAVDNIPFVAQTIINQSTGAVSLKWNTLDNSVISSNSYYAIVIS